MATVAKTVELLRSEIIEKISSIHSLALLEELSASLSVKTQLSHKQHSNTQLTDAQKQMLRMSENDIENGALISQDEPNVTVKKSRAGSLAKYANPKLIDLEKTAWETAMAEKYAHR